MNQTAVKRAIKKLLGQRLTTWVKYRLPFLVAKHSYSQTGEDLILDYFLGYQQSGFYIDIGACDHLDLSNTYKFYRRGWKGIQIEPNPTKARQFQKYRPETLTLNIGIGSEEKNAPFFIFETDSLSTFSEEEAQSSTSFGHHIIETTQIPMLPLKAVFATHTTGKQIDFMSIDTEGFDMEVLHTNDWDLYRPRFIILETAEYNRTKFGKKENDQYDPVMKELGYEKVADTYINTIYRDTKSTSVGW